MAEPSSEPGMGGPGREELEESLIREVEEALPYSHRDDEATPLEVLRYALTAGAFMRRGPMGALEAVAGHVALVRYASGKLNDFCQSEDPDDRIEGRELLELIQRNLASIEAQARAAAKWFAAGGK